MRRLAIFCLLFIAVCFFAFTSRASTRHVELFTGGWRFLQSDALGAQAPAFDDSSWQTVTLPHDWAIAGPIDEKNPTGPAGGFFPAGIGWYRKTFDVPASASTRRTFIVFDGVMANSDVWINGELLGHRPYGYVSFYYDLTDHLHYGGQNTIAVRVDDSRQPASRWYAGAGINRQVRLVTTSSTHIEPWGAFVTTPSVSAGSASIDVTSTVANQSTASSTVRLRVSLIAPDGHLVKPSLLYPEPSRLALTVILRLKPVSPIQTAGTSIILSSIQFMRSCSITISSSANLSNSLIYCRCADICGLSCVCCLS